MGLRETFNESLKQAMKTGDKRRVSTLRLVNAAIKDRDILARTAGPDAGVSDAQVLELLTKMIKQRQESEATYAAAGRADLAQTEAEEIAIIQSFMPQQLSEAQTKDAAAAAILEIGAAGMKDMGKVVAALKAKYSGQMDFAKASALVKALLS